jgi:hypothetical protein
MEYLDTFYVASDLYTLTKESMWSIFVPWWTLNKPSWNGRW